MRLKSGVPVLALPHGGVRVGLHSHVDFHALDAQQRAWMAQLEGPYAEVDPATYPFLTRKLEAAGLVHDERATPVRDTAVRVHGPQAMRRSVERCLEALGIRAGETVAAFEEVAIEVVVSRGAPSPTAVGFLARDQRHLIVTTDEAGVTVGPLIVPGSTACITCLGLHRTQSDPQWPFVALQCEARPPVIEPVLLPEVAALTARACRVAAAGHDPGVWRVEPHSMTHDRTPPPHPECRCTDDGDVVPLPEP